MWTLSRLAVVSFCVVISFYDSSALAQSKGLIEQATKETKVTWYTQPGTREVLEKPLAQWRSLYPGVNIEFVEGTGPELEERIRTERRAGRAVADVLSYGDSSAYLMSKTGGYQAFDPAEVPNLSNLQPRVSGLSPQNYFVPTQLFAYGVNVNTRVLPETEWPKRWSDLLDPKYKGKMTFHDPSRPGGGSNFLTIAYQALGESWFRRLFQQDLRVFGRSPEVEGAVVRGERAIAIASRSRVPLDYPGAPVKWLVMEEGATFNVYTAGIVAKAPHPAAATLLLNFLLSKSVQQTVADLGDVPVVTGVNSQISIDRTKFLGPGLAGAAEFEALPERLQFGKQLVEGIGR